MIQYTIYCDGASRKDGRGGWGASIESKGREIHGLYGGEYETTNNRMELMGAIEPLWFLPPQSRLRVISDSQYLVKGITEYIETWIRAGWRTSANKPLANDDLWRELHEATKRHLSIEWQWVKGHTGVRGNERADWLATLGVPES